MRLCPASITYTLIENEVKVLVKRPLTFVQSILAPFLLGVREDFLAVYIPGKQLIRPLKTEYMVLVRYNVILCIALFRVVGLTVSVTPL